MKKLIQQLALIGLVACCTGSCKQSTASGDEGAATDETITPVTITHPSTGDMKDNVTVNAISVFLLKTYVKANTNGYLQSVNLHLGQWVSKGQVLFTIKTKEAEALGNTINSLDTSLHFEGTLRVKSTGNGYLTQLSYTNGNYVQDGEQLAEISDASAFAFVMDLPYELKPYMSNNKTVQLRLPDGTVLAGTVQAALPTVDSVSQTQRYTVKVNTGKLIPENLVAKISLVKSYRPHTIILPRAAVLSDEAQTNYWVMQLLNDSTAVKLPVQKGLETTDEVEILSPHLNETDRVLLTGNYGLNDTAKVIIKQ